MSRSKTKSRKPKAERPPEHPAAAAFDPSAIDPTRPPRTPDELHAWLERVLDVRAQRVAMIQGHAAPFEYLLHAYFEGATVPDAEREPLPAPAGASGDCVVWANRGGGKTFLGAVASLLDALYKPGVQVRILGGSLEQSQRMQEHLRVLCERPLVSTMVDGRPTARRINFKTGSRVEVLAASQTSVRGTRVQKIRCDEVDLFDPEVWTAAQLTTRSMKLDGPWGRTVRGCVEALSTMHRPYGLMWGLVGARSLGDSAQEAEPLKRQVGHARAESRPRPARVFRWGVLDVLETCGDEHACASCVLWPDCRGRAKASGDGRQSSVLGQESSAAERRSSGDGQEASEAHAESQALTPDAPRLTPSPGHISIADAITMRERVDAITWSAEMLCRRPRRTDAVFPEFDPEVHVCGREQGIGALGTGGKVEGRATAPCPCPLAAGPAYHVAGMDFGFRGETALLLARIEPITLDDDSPISARPVLHRSIVRIIDEHVVRGQRLERHIERLLAWDEMARSADTESGAGLLWVGVDPAGHNRSDQSGLSNITLMKQAGLTVRSRRLPLDDGVRLVRSRMVVEGREQRDSGSGKRESATPPPAHAALYVHQRCVRLIECLERYHYPAERPESMEPVKDGFDHACDALRYLIVNLDRAGRSESRRV